MLTVVLLLLAGVAVLIGVSFLLSRLVLRRGAAAARRAMPAIGPRDFEESAVGLTKPYQGYGLLRITPAEVLFAAGPEVLTIQRRSIAACMVSDDVPTGTGMQTLRRPALLLQLRDPELPSGVAFAVSDPAAWVQRIRRR